LANECGNSVEDPQHRGVGVKLVMESVGDVGHDTDDGGNDFADARVIDMGHKPVDEDVVLANKCGDDVLVGFLTSFLRGLSGTRVEQKVNGYLAL